MLVLYFLLIGPPLSARESLSGPVPATVLRVIDGDSLVVRVTIWLGQELETTVRLLGVDTPELRGACGEERDLVTRSRAFTSGMAGTGAKISLSDIQLGKFAGRVFRPGVDRRRAGARLSRRAPWLVVRGRFVRRSAGRTPYFSGRHRTE